MTGEDLEVARLRRGCHILGEDALSIPKRPSQESRDAKLLEVKRVVESRYHRFPYGMNGLVTELLSRVLSFGSELCPETKAANCMRGTQRHWKKG